MLSSEDQLSYSYDVCVSWYEEVQGNSQGVQSSVTTDAILTVTTIYDAEEAVKRVWGLHQPHFLSYTHTRSISAGNIYHAHVLLFPTLT